MPRHHLNQCWLIVLQITFQWNFCAKFKICQCRKSISKPSLQNVGHFVAALMCWYMKYAQPFYWLWIFPSSQQTHTQTVRCNSTQPESPYQYICDTCLFKTFIFNKSSFAPRRRHISHYKSLTHYGPWRIHGSTWISVQMEVSWYILLSIWQCLRCRDGMPVLLTYWSKNHSKEYISWIQNRWISYP